MPGTRGAIPLPGKELTQDVLSALATKDTFETNIEFPNTQQRDIRAALDRLGSRSMIEYDTIEAEQVLLTEEGATIAEKGSHEYRVWQAVKSQGEVTIKELQELVGTDTAKIGQGVAFRNKWIRKSGGNLLPEATAPEDTTRALLRQIQTTRSADPKLLSELKKRKLVSTSKILTYSVRKGSKYSSAMAVEVTDLTAEMLANSSWQDTNLKPYNFNAHGADQNAGALHPLMKVRTEFRHIFFNQGFVEMPTYRFVESGFWNFDALFVPQQHPARDQQDTFFIADPPAADMPREEPRGEADMEAMEAGARLLYQAREKRAVKLRDYRKYFDDVVQVHERGGFGSIGYRYPWSKDECLKLVLRTHTTAVSTWCLHRLAEDPRPARYFSIDRVFRNEAVDATHLAEFHQVEGVIADFGLTLGGLMRFFEDFFGKLGLTNLRFKPAYNPYTEPSMEIFGVHTGLGKWIEIGNSGMFRPEMLEPMGLPKDLRVYGFGLSLERPTMIKYGVNNIRELLGHKVDLGFIESNSAVRLEKN